MRKARKAVYHANLAEAHALKAILQASEWSESIETKIRSFAESASERLPGPTAYPKLSKSSRPLFASFEEGSDSSNAPLQSMKRNFAASRALPTRRVSFDLRVTPRRGSKPMLQGKILATLDPSIDKSSCAGRPQRREPPARALDRPHPGIQADPVRRREAVGITGQPSSADGSLPQPSAAENAFSSHLPATELKIPNECDHTAHHTRPNDTPNNFVLRPPQGQNAVLDPNAPYQQTICVSTESRYLRYPNDPDGMAPTGEAKMSETPTDSINDQKPSLPEHTAKQILLPRRFH